MTRLTAACEAVDRALVEAQEASAAIDSVAETFEFEPDRLEKTEERLFALRAMARKLNVATENLPAVARRLRRAAASHRDLRRGPEGRRGRAASARDGYVYAAEALSAERRAAGDRWPWPSRPS
jgi:DNA repair protein RecN (Recombination protein N)